ncbi:hypothetical protein CBR_g51638 [Chara braunii]|uniref:CCHC-type domain-containing protein n=1 Tax=Chara braunii TaxID=69332 RepID=A0A388M8V4_CHABU|nr:hypothetical protein CBR_g51638 [Chara braunii]|eukprot:GBG90980.1 hypothetical protein CBR_g51638 [Chara braunii]
MASLGNARTGAGGARSPIICFNCNQVGHMARDCPVGRGQGAFTNNAKYWQSRKENEDCMNRVVRWADYKMQKEMEKEENKKAEEERRRMEAERRKQQMEEENRDERIRRMILEECDQREKKIEEAELRTIAAVSRDLWNFRAEIRTEIQMVLAVNSKTPKRDREAFANGLDTYLTKEEVLMDDESKIPPKRARGKRIARNYIAPNDLEEEARVMSRADYEKSLRRKTSTPMKNGSPGKENPALCSNGNMNARDRGKGYLRQLLEMPLKRKELALLPVDKLMHLYNCAATFKEKEKRRMIKDFLEKAVGRKVGVNIRNRVTVRVRYSKEVKKSGIRNVLITQIESCGLHPAIAGIFKRKARVVWRRNRNVAEILCNYKQLSKKPKLQCTCKQYDLPIVKGHVLTRIGDVTELPSLLLNGKNVVRPRIETTEDERSKHCDTDERLVYSVKKKFGDLLITQVDRNAGDLVLMCPSTYQHGLDKLFSWSLAYDEVSSSEAEILKVMKDFVDRGLHKLVNWNLKGRIGQSYFLPKHKDLKRWRPIAPACSEPTMTGSRWIARALNFLLEKLPGVEHFNLTATALLKQNLKKAEKKLQQYGKDTMTICGGFDIKEMFTSLLHSAIMEALSWLLGEWEKKGYQKITVCKRRKQVTLGLKTFGKGHVKFSFSYIQSFVSFELQHTYTTCRGKLLRQVIGVPMEKNSSPPLACLLCARYEDGFQRSLGSDRKLVHGVRFMDDAMLAVVCNRRKEESISRAVEILTKFGSCYGDKLSLVPVVRMDDGSNTIEFVGSKLTAVPGKTLFLLEPKTKNGLSVQMGEVQQRLVHRCFQDFSSYSDKRAKLGAIIGCLHRIQQMANSESTLLLPVLALKYELLRWGYPPTFFFSALTRFA